MLLDEVPTMKGTFIHIGAIIQIPAFVMMRSTGPFQYDSIRQST